MEDKRGTPLSVNIPDTPKPRVVILGGGFGGIQMLHHLDIR